jgi:hypothetical protein
MYRRQLERLIAQHPELFPQAISAGFWFHDCYPSVKQRLVLRRVKLKATGAVYQLRPSFVLPYLVGRTAEVEKALYLRQWGVPFDALAYLFGRDPLFWYRAWLSFGRVSLVGTTVKDPGKLPRDLVADEKQTWVGGHKVYVPTTAAGGCILGATVVAQADGEALTQGYGEFAQEAHQLAPAYQPQTACTDGWHATREAWQRLYPAAVLVLCFLHSVIKIRDRCRGALRRSVVDKAWHVYQGATKRQFAQRLRRLGEWASAHLAGPVQETVLKLRQQRERFLPAYDFARAHRTSNAVDRLMNYQARLLYAMRYFHHSTAAARLGVRAMALQWNFHPYGVRLRRAQPSRRSPFHDLNGFQYHDNWLHNLLIAASLGGRRC